MKEATRIHSRIQDIIIRGYEDTWSQSCRINARSYEDTYETRGYDDSQTILLEGYEDTQWGSLFLDVQERGYEDTQWESLF